MKNNKELQKDVEEAIKCEPLLNATEIKVIAEDGIVTLTGIVDSIDMKFEAEHATRKVVGVKAVVEKIEIKSSCNGKQFDNEIAIEVLNALKLNDDIENGKVKINVEGGLVTLEGELEWNYQRESAEKSINHLFRVNGVINKIKTKSETMDEVEKSNIERALVRNESLNDKNIKVSVSGNNVILNGNVNSLYEKSEAEKIALNAPGVWTVDNKLIVIGS